MTACHNGDNNNKGARLSCWTLNHLQAHLQKRRDIQEIQFVRKKCFLWMHRSLGKITHKETHSYEPYEDSHTYIIAILYMQSLIYLLCII